MGKTLNRVVFIEGMIVFGLGVLSMIEGVRLTLMDRIQMYDVLGPGRYNFGVGLLLIIISLGYLISFRKEKQFKSEMEGSEIAEKEYRIRMMGMFIALGIYITFIYFLGYLISTVVFFLLIHRVVGFRSWVVNGGMSLGMSFAFYYVFVYGLNMIFPKGVIMEWLSEGIF